MLHAKLFETCLVEGLVTFPAKWYTGKIRPTCSTAHQMMRVTPGIIATCKARKRPDKFKVIWVHVSNRLGKHLSKIFRADLYLRGPLVFPNPQWRVQQDRRGVITDESNTLDECDHV